MGCDIHLHIEVKIDGEWEHYSHPVINRDYSLFAKMAGVRNYTEETPIAILRGVPDDISKITRLDYKKMGTDAHSASWFDITDIMQLESWLREHAIKLKEQQAPEKQTQIMFNYHLEHSILRTYLFGCNFVDIVRYPEEIRIPGLQDLRFVFWFDN